MLTLPILLLFLLTFAIIFLRYLVLAGAYHYFFHRVFRERFTHRLLHSTPVSNRQLRRELFWSAISAVIFALFGLVVLWLWSAGYTKIYTDWSAYSPVYTVFSVPIILLLQDTFYYWLHRWMHRPAVYRRVHKVHHDSIQTSAFASFSFHPWETLAQAAFLPLLLLILPVHLYVLLGVLVLMTVSAIINHAGVSVVPEGRLARWLAQWLIGADHHDRHHRKFTVNYGLYFTFWDRLMGTEAGGKSEVGGWKSEDSDPA